MLVEFRGNDAVIFVNSLQVIAVQQVTKDGCMLSMAHCLYLEYDAIFVFGTLDEVAAKLNGEAPCKS
jgi:hypothetical protein